MAANYTDMKHRAASLRQLSYLSCLCWLLHCLNEDEWLTANRRLQYVFSATHWWIIPTPTYQSIKQVYPSYAINLAHSGWSFRPIPDVFLFSNFKPNNLGLHEAVQSKASIDRVCLFKPSKCTALVVCLHLTNFWSKSVPLQTLTYLPMSFLSQYSTVVLTVVRSWSLCIGNRDTGVTVAP